MGLAAALDSRVSAVAPMKAPTAPGPARIATMRQSTFPNLWWEIPEASVVPIWAKCTAADAAAGAIPAATRMVVEVTPYPMPSEPSTSWARSPAKPRTIRVGTGGSSDVGR